jgi:branched-chain amino acid transport system permease protein
MMLDSLSDLYWTYQNIIHGIAVNGILALSVYVVLSIGQLALGQAAFMGIGAYFGAIATTKLGLPFPVAILISVVVPAAVAFAIGAPTLLHRAIAHRACDGSDARRRDSGGRDGRQRAAL